MLFKEYTYSVLLVSSSAKFTKGLLSLLPENEFAPVDTAKSIGEARRKLLDRGFDLVLINAPLPDDFGAKLALDVSADSRSGVLMFVNSDVYDEITDRMIDCGVFTLAKPAAASMIRQVLKIMYAMQERFRSMEKKTATLEEKMKEIRIVNHAKWILIENLKLSELEAHRVIEKQAMDTRRTKREVAEGIIKTYEN